MVKKVSKIEPVQKSMHNDFNVYRYKMNPIFEMFFNNDVTKCFASEREFACCEGLRKPGEASFSVESLEDSICVIIPYSSIVEGVKKGNEMTAIINKYSQKALADAERHTRGLLTKSALDRYIEFKSEYGVIEDRISQAHIASYIGIRASSLSRIKRSMKIE